MKNLYKDAVTINMMADDANKESAARAFFERLNAMKLPEYFNWVEEIFEGLHVKERGEHKALIWTDIVSREVKTYTYRELAVQGNKCLNALRRAGIEKGDNMVMMVPIFPETWFAGLACIKGGLVAVPTATTMTLRELQFRFESYAPDAILCDAKFTDLMDEAIRATGVKPKIKIVLGDPTQAQNGWTGYADLDGEPETAGAARTKAQDLLFCFFTSGTTGLPKKVGHTAVSYPVGHLSTTLLTGIRP
nr:acyl-CoA synthetase [Desulfobacula sp.]